MGEINIKKLAKELNVSPSTVSRALSDSHEISEETKKKVRELALKLNYKPNPFASSLRENRSKTIAIIIPDMLNNFFSQVIEGVQQIVQEHNYHLLIYLTHEDYEKEKEITAQLLNGRVEGVMMSLSSQTKNYDHLHALQNRNIPILFFDRICDAIATTKFTTNDYESAYKATAHLIEKKCKRIAFTYLSKEISICRNRKRGYLDALNDHGLRCREEWILQCGNEQASNREKIGRLLQSDFPPDGILSSVEKLAIDTYYVCREMNVAIPQDLKIVSFSNLKIADLLNPSLTTISQPTLHLGREAAGLLMKYLIKKKKPVIMDQTIVLPSRLCIRDSTS